MTRTRILTTGRALPAKVVTNADLEKLVETNDEWIVQRTGIKERRVLEEDRGCSDLAAEAALHACGKSGISPREIDCIIIATVTPDLPMPAMAVYVQKKIGAPVGAAFDISAACAGFVYGLALADGLVAKGQFKRVLVVGVEILSRVLDWTDRGTCVLFGDGAGAAILGPGVDDRGIVSTHLFADGAGADYLFIPPGGKVHMDGKPVFIQAVKNIAAACQEALSRNGLTAADIDLVVAHQANLRIVQGVAERCGIPMDKFFLNIHKYGNTSSASIPIALDEAIEAGRVRPGMTILMCALGAGFSWGSAVVKW